MDPEKSINNYQHYIYIKLNFIITIIIVLVVIIVYIVDFSILMLSFNFPYIRMLPLLSESLLTQCLSRDWCLTSLSLVISLLTPLIRHHGIVKRLCSQSGKCYNNNDDNLDLNYRHCWQFDCR